MKHYFISKAEMMKNKGEIKDVLNKAGFNMDAEFIQMEKETGFHYFQPEDSMEYAVLRTVNDPDQIIARVAQNARIRALNAPEYDVENIFTYHAPKGDQVTRYGVLRDKAKELACLIMVECPVSRERSTALTRLEECIMHANASIARNE